MNADHLRNLQPDIATAVPPSGRGHSRSRVLSRARVLSRLAFLKAPRCLLFLLAGLLGPWVLASLPLPVRIAVLPFLVFLRTGGGTEAGRPGRTATLVLAALFLLNLLLAAPGRRYEGGEESPEIRQVAASPADVRGALSWVHENITRKCAPFTDRALDTLSRGEATCGGMANLLDKILKAMKIPSRIVHLERGRRIHTLVEYRKDPPGRWVLADPQENLVGDDYGDISGCEAVLGNPGGDLPGRWKGYTDLFVYRQGRGYRRVEKGNAGEFYGKP